jgi:hypothetical protein
MWGRKIRPRRLSAIFLPGIFLLPLIFERIHDAVAALLHHLKSPIFVPINYTDFWRKIPAHRRYCVICLKLSIDRKKEVPKILRELLSFDEFDTRRKLMGKVISVSEGVVQYYE